MKHHAFALHFVFANDLVWKYEGRKIYFGNFKPGHFVVGPVVISWKKWYD